MGVPAVLSVGCSVVLFTFLYPLGASSFPVGDSFVLVDRGFVFVPGSACIEAMSCYEGVESPHWFFMIKRVFGGDAYPHRAHATILWIRLGE